MTYPARASIDGLAGADSGTRAPEGAATGNATDKSLRASGRTCTRCGYLIDAEQPARRRANGEYIHDTCPGDWSLPTE
jgi:hypothetical protein